MSQAAMQLLSRFERNLRQAAGDEIAAQVLAGREKIRASSSPARIAEWMKEAVERLDALAGPELRSQVLLGCGSECAQSNQRSIDQAKQRKSQYPSLDAFLRAEVERPISGARLGWNGSTLTITYTPYELDSPVRCYCPLLRGLPEEETMPRHYCQCSQAYTRHTWEAILERPVSVEVAHTCLSGTNECSFQVHVQEA